MSILIFANNAKTTLANALTSTSTVINLSAGTGSEFPQPVGAEYFVLTLTDAATGLINEIVWCTSRSADALTVTRGQESTTAKAWLINDFASCRPTAGTQSEFVQPDQLQEGLYGYTVAGGTANVLTGAIASNLTALPDGLPVVIKAGFANTSTVTFQLTLGATLLSAYPIVKGNNGALVAGDIPAVGYQIQANWSAAFNSFIMQNPATGVSTIPTGSIYQFPCAGASLPTGFLITNGALVSRTTYAALYAFAVASGNIVSDATWLGGQYGAFSSGDGSTTFRLPQYGGYFLRTLDNGNGIDPSRVIGTVQGGQNVSHSHAAASTSTSSSGATVTDPGHHHQSNGIAGTGQGASGANTVQQSAGSQSTTTVGTGVSVTVATTTGTSTTITADGGTEARPINVSVLTCIKY